jgi:DNA polymerase/3'-5' exonuclease PolX
MSDKPKFDFSVAHVIATQIVSELEPACERITIAGSLRRCEKTVGDIEILYCPRYTTGKRPGDLVASTIDLSLAKIWDLINAGVLVRRQNTNGSDTFGPRNKLMRHASGIPVDLFATDERSWANYLVCRTGPAAFNIRVATRARALGWKWHPYDCGFSRKRCGGELIEWQVIRSEEQLFEFLGWPYCQPWERAAGNSPVSATRSSEEKTGVEAQSAKAEPATQKPGKEAGRAHA